MEKVQLYKHAYFGLAHKLKLLDKEIAQGYEMIRDYENSKTTKTKSEIKQAIEEKEKQYKEAEKEFDTIKWVLAELEEKQL